MAWRPPQRPGDRDPAIVDAKHALRRYSYGQGLGDTTEYTPAFGVALRQFQINRNQQILDGAVRDMPGMNIDGILDWATKKNLLILPEQLALPPTALPVIFTVAGHRGDMFDGPAYFTARHLEEQGQVRVQPVGFDNVSIPFANPTGVGELHRLTHDPMVLPPGTPWALAGHSQGGIVASQFYLDHIRHYTDDPVYHDFRGGLMFGNPYREQDVVAPWISDPPARGSYGISDRRITDTPPEWMEVARTGDLYAENTDDVAGRMKTAVYKAVQGDIFGAGSLAEQIGKLVTQFGAKVWGIFEAIVSGVRFLANMGPHGIFDLRPCIDFMRDRLAAPA